VCFWARLAGLLGGVALAALAVPAGAQTPPATSAKPSAPRQASAKKKKKSTQARRQLTPEPARIREIQEALAREGFYKGEPSGKWDEGSIEAMKDFQAAKGLPATGKLEALSLQKLGLGSPVAGMAAPAPRPSADPPANPTKPPR
jgi:peptidoglycan hydrolase-like protein with peptidoglycan-binding domain